MSRQWTTSAADAVTRFLSSIRKFLRNAAGASVDEPLPARVYWDSDVTLTLQNLVQDAETRASGRVQVITLADFRSAIGDLWDKYEQRILLIAESTISRMIGRGNTFIPQEKDTWLLLFPGLPEDEAVVRADAIAARIGEKLVGAQFSEPPPPPPLASRLDLTGALNADGSLNFDRLKAAVEQVRKAAKNADIPVVAVKRPGGPAARGAITSPVHQTKAETFQITVGFRPAWNAETQSIDSFFFRGASPNGSDLFASNTPPPEDIAVLDFVAAGGRAFSEMCERGLRAILTVPVPFETLQGPHLADIQRLITGLRQRDRLLQLRLEITHVPYRARAEQLVAMREIFRPYVRDVAFQLDLFLPSDQVLALDHVVLGTELTHQTRQGDDDLFQAMMVFRQRAGRRATYILGLHSRLQVAHALTAGISEVGGPAIHAEMKKLPDQVVVISRQDLLI